MNAETLKNTLKPAHIVFASIHYMHKLKRHCNKFDVILFDDAHEVNEALSTMLLLFSPSAVILFGDPYRGPIDCLGMQQKYPNHNFNQSMFERIRKCGRCVRHLDLQYRLGENLSRCMSTIFYGKRPLGCRRVQPSKPLDAMQIYHRKADAFCFSFIKNLLKKIKPKDYSYTIVYPPNVGKNAIIADSLE